LDSNSPFSSNLVVENLYKHQFWHLGSVCLMLIVELCLIGKGKLKFCFKSVFCFFENLILKTVFLFLFFVFVWFG
jgi:hypothetical protein